MEFPSDFHGLHFSCDTTICKLTIEGFWYDYYEDNHKNFNCESYDLQAQKISDMIEIIETFDECFHQLDKFITGLK